MALGLTKPAQDVYAPTTTGGAPRGAVMGEAQRWGMEIEATLDAAIVAGLSFQGAWDASGGSFPGSGASVKGQAWAATVAGTVGGIAFAVGDLVIALVNSASTSTYATNWIRFAPTKGDDGIDGASSGILMTWSTSTTDADPGGGYVRADNADLSLATEIYIDKANRAGSSIAALLAAVPQGRLIITDPASEAQAALVLGVVEDATGYVKFPVSAHSGATSFANDLAISLQFPDPSLSAMVRLDVEDQEITGGARVVAKSLGNLLGETITPDPGDRARQKIVNNGDGSILPGTNEGSYTLIIINASGAGAITTTGWTLIGDAFDTESTSKFVCSAIVDADIKALFVRKVA